MRSAPRRALLGTALAAAFGMMASASHAVRLDPDGLGQALIFPYYTVQSAVGNPLNTYLSIVNTTSAAKAVRVRFREGRMGAEVGDFNLFLSPNDVWTAALAPTSDGTQLLTVDRSCTEPTFSGAAGALRTLDFNALAYSGGRDDGAGSGLDRTREGYVEMIEMATLTGAAAAAVTQTSAGVPANCAAVQAGAPIAVAAPSGGLSGGLTLINVANGTEFSANAVALAQLATRPFFRAASDPYPDWNAAEIDPVSAVVANGAVYRATWSRPVDAVSAVLMRSAWLGEYVIDATTASLTDIVLTFPTRRFYVTTSTFAAPFSNPAQWSVDCLSSPSEVVKGELVATTFRNREALGPAPDGIAFPEPPPPAPAPEICATAAVIPVGNGNWNAPASPSAGALGSRTGGFTRGVFQVRQSFQNGWLRFAPRTAAAHTSAASSTRLDERTGAITTSAQTYLGLPVVGLMVRTMTNGTLTCTSGQCQGTYGGAFPLQFERSISP